jgi:hypothetical protein
MNNVFFILLLSHEGGVMNERTETMPNTATMYKKAEVLPNMSTIGRSSWSAVFSGTVIALIVNVTLSLLGIGIGLSSISGSPTAGTLQNVGVGTVIWAAIIGIVAMYIGGWVTSRFAGMQRSFDGVLHGLVTWGLTSLIMLTLLTGAVGAAVSGGVNMIRGASSATAQAYAALPPEQRQQIQSQVQQGAQQRQQQLGQGQQQGQLQQRAQQMGAQAASVTSKAAWGGFIILLLGGIAAAFGGAAGRIKGPVKV